MQPPFETIIIENEILQLNLLKELIEYHEEIFSVPVTSTPHFHEAIDIFNKKKFQISILDIYLDGNDCYELIRIVGRDRFGIIVIATDKDSVSPERAYTVKEPYVFLRKPYNSDRVLKLIKDINEKIDEFALPDHSDLDVNINTTLKNLIEKLNSTRMHFMENLFTITETATTNLVVNQKHIYCVEVDDKVTFFYIYDAHINKYVRKRSIDNLSLVLERLNGDSFIQCHKSYIVNVGHILRTSKPTTDAELAIGKEGIIHLLHDKCPMIPYGGEFKDNLLERINARRL